MNVIVRARFAAIVLAALVATVVLIGGPLAPAAHATNLSVSTEAEYRDAITALSADSSGPHTITLGANLTLTGASTAIYTGTQDLTIVSDPGATDPIVVTHDALSPLGFLEFAPTSDATLTLDRIVVEGFAGGPAVTASGSVVLDTAVFLNNSTDSLQGAVAVENGEVTVIDTVFDGNGGGLFAADTAVTVVDSTFVGNSTVPDDLGDIDPDFIGLGTSALSVVFGTLDVSGSVFSDNEALFVGGAIFSVGTEATIADTTFSNNGVYTDDVFCADPGTFLPCGGGAIASYIGYLEISDSEFFNNSVLDDNCAVIESTEGFFGIGGLIPSCSGGAITTIESYVDVRDSEFAGNDAFAGGALGFIVSLVSVSGSTFDGNQADVGGAIFAGYAATLLIDSTLHDNVAEFGGAVAMVSDPESEFFGETEFPTGDELAEFLSGTSDDIIEGYFDEETFFPGLGLVVNSTITGNVATGDGGGIGLEGALLYLEHVTMAANETTAGSAGHLFIQDSEVLLRASALVDAVGGDACAGLTEAGANLISGGYNFSDDSSCFGDSGGEPTDQISADPVLLGALADNGGAGLTMEPQAGSPLIDVIPAAQCHLDYDQRGHSRPQDGDDDDTPACDVGAVEVAAAYLSFSVDTPGGVVEGRIYGALSIEGVGGHSIASLGGTAPAGIAFPFAAIAFTAIIATPGESITVVLELPSPAIELWKHQNGAWFELEDADVDGTTITYELTDGETGDADGSANAVIVDPVAAGVSAAFTG
jgi:hypothetical protein